MNQQDIEYALAKQVPDMARGFRISTSYGDIVIEGSLASLMAAQLDQYLQEHLQELQGYDATQTGGEWVHSEAQLSVPDAQTISDSVMALHAVVESRLQAVCDQLASLRLAVLPPSSAGHLPAQPGSPSPAQSGGAPAARMHCSALSEPCVGLALQQPVAPAPATAVPDLACFSPKVD